VHIDIDPWALAGLKYEVKTTTTSTFANGTPMSTHPKHAFILCAASLIMGCGAIGGGNDDSTPKAPPAGHCEELCNHLDAVNKELMCDQDNGLGESHTVDVPGCIADCNEPAVCMDQIVAYDKCRISLEADAFVCASRRDNDPLIQNTGENCGDEFSAAFDCQSDNL